MKKVNFFQKYFKKFQKYFGNIKMLSIFAKAIR